MPLLEQHDLVVPQLAAEADRLGGAARDAGDLLARSARRSPSRRSRARARCRSWAAKPAIIPAWVEPVTEQTTTVSKKTPSSRSWSATSSAQRAKPRPPSGWSEAPAGIAYGLPPRSSTDASAVLPARAEADVEARRVEPDVGAHDPREKDVPDLVVDGVRPVDPVLLDEHAARARAAPRRPRPGACGSTGRRRSRRACRSPARARRPRGIRACAPCCRRTRGRSCSPRASPRSRPARRGARSAARGGAPAKGRRAAARGRSPQDPQRRWWPPLETESYSAAGTP